MTLFPAGQENSEGGGDTSNFLYGTAPGFLLDFRETQGWQQSIESSQNFEMQSKGQICSSSLFRQDVLFWPWLLACLGDPPLKDRRTGRKKDQELFIGRRTVRPPLVFFRAKFSFRNKYLGYTYVLKTLCSVCQFVLHFFRQQKICNKEPQINFWSNSTIFCGGVKSIISINFHHLNSVLFHIIKPFTKIGWNLFVHYFLHCLDRK